MKPILTKDVRGGDRFVWSPNVETSVSIEVIRVARDGSWADLRIRPSVGPGWSKRQRNQLPDHCKRVKA